MSKCEMCMTEVPEGTLLYLEERSLAVCEDCEQDYQRAKAKLTGLFVHTVKNPQSGRGVGDFEVRLQKAEDGTVDLNVQHNGCTTYSDDTGIHLEDAGPDEALHVLRGLLTGITRATLLMKNCACSDCMPEVV